MMKTGSVLLVGLLIGSAAGATPFDGKYLPEEFSGGAGTCAGAGQPDGITWIEGDTIVTTLFGCRLSNPVEVREKNAVRYDARCQSESEYGGGQLLLSWVGDRLLLLDWGEYSESWLKCR